MTSNHPQPEPLTLEEAYQKLGELLKSQSPYTKTNISQVVLLNQDYRKVSLDPLNSSEDSPKMKALRREMDRLVGEVEDLLSDLETLRNDLRS